MPVLEYQNNTSVSQASANRIPLYKLKTNQKRMIGQCCYYCQCVYFSALRPYDRLGKLVLSCNHYLGLNDVAWLLIASQKSLVVTESVLSYSKWSVQSC